MRATTLADLATWARAALLPGRSLSVHVHRAPTTPSEGLEGLRVPKGSVQLADAEMMRQIEPARAPYCRAPRPLPEMARAAV